MIEHRNVNNFIEGISNKIDFSGDEKILCLTTISFDIFALETLLPLTKGMTIVLANESEQRDPNEILKLITENNIDVLQATPSRLAMILQAKAAKESIRNLSKIIVGGEAFNEKILKDLREYEFKNKIFNVYGPTETTVWSTVKDLTNSENITIGKPIVNTQIYILDKNGCCQPIGVPGELYIAGDSLARGYLNREDLTKERFIKNPFENNKFMYRTGDLAKWLENGEVKFVGRVDHQVKLRGYRIELSEIEKSMIELKEIEECACVVRQDDNEQDYIAAYFVSEKALETYKIRQHLLKFLPEYMIPEAYCQIDKMPMTPNCKVDKKSLPKICRSKTVVETEYIEGQTDLEKKITKVWEAILKRDRIGINDNFFELGGNSLLVVTMYNELEKICPGKLTIADIFSNPTISSLNQFLENGSDTKEETHINKIELPEQYLLKGQEVNEDIVLEYKLEGEAYNRLKKLSAITRFSLRSIFLSAYVYLLAEVTEKENVPVQAVLDKNKFSQLEFDLKEIIDFKSLFNEVEAVKASSENRYEICNLIRKKERGDGKITAAFVYNLENVLRITQSFDLVLSCKDLGNRAEISLHYNFKVIKINKAEKLLQLYINIINTIKNNL